MEKLVNIPSYIQDDKYRYTMPAIQCKIQSKGNGIRTSFPNLQQIANAIRCPAELILKFFCIERGSHEKSSEKGYTINGSFTQEEMRGELDKFIEKYILCQKCKYPEIERKLEQNQLIGICDACRWTGLLDNKHKVAKNFMKKLNEEMGALKRDKKNKKKKQLEQLEQKEKKEKENTVKQKRVEAPELELDSQTLKQFLQRIVYQRIKLESQRSEQDIISADLAMEIKKFNIEKSLIDRFSYLIFHGLFTPNICKELSIRSFMLRYLYTKFKITNPTSELLLNLSHLIHLNPALERLCITIMKHMLDGELLDSAKIIQWYQSPISQHFLYQQDKINKFKSMIKPFVQWLNSNDQEEEDEQA